MATLTFTNTGYTIAPTDGAATGMPPGDLAYYMSYRDDWTTTSGFTTVDWNEWVDQVEEYQTTISAAFGADAKSAVYSFLSWCLAGGSWSLEEDETLTGWAYVMAIYDYWTQTLAGGDLWSDSTRDDWFDSFDWEANCTVCPHGVEGLRILSTDQYGAMNYYSYSYLYEAITGWLRYMWGAIKNDDVLEPSDVSNGYST